MPILATLTTYPSIFYKYRLDGIITTVDAATATATIDRQPELSKQIAVADRILLTKTDLASPSAVRVLEEKDRFDQPGAPIPRAYNGVVDAASLFNTGVYDPESKSEEVRAWLRDEAFTSADSENLDSLYPQQDRRVRSRHDEHIRSVSLVIDDPLPARVFDTWLDALMALQGPDLLRP